MPKMHSEIPRGTRLKAWAHRWTGEHKGYQITFYDLIANLDPKHFTAQYREINGVYAWTLALKAELLIAIEKELPDSLKNGFVKRLRETLLQKLKKYKSLDTALAETKAELIKEIKEQIRRSYNIDLY